MGWLVLWALLLIFGDYLRTDRVADFLESGEGSMNFILAFTISVLFIVAVYATALSRRR